MRSIGYGSYGDYGLTAFGDVESAQAALNAAIERRDAIDSSSDPDGFNAAQKDVTFAQQQLQAAQASDAKSDAFAQGIASSILGAGLAFGAKAGAAELGLDKQAPRPAGQQYAPGQQLQRQQEAPKSNLGMALGIAAGLGVLTVVIILATRK